MSPQLTSFTQRLPRWQRVGLYVTGAAVALSGIAWLGFDVSGATADPFSSLRPTQHRVSVLHGVASLAMLLLVGAMLPVHVRLGLAFRNRFVSGMSLLVVLLALCATGGALYYVSAEGLRAAASTSHEILGIIGILVFAIHRLVRKTR